MISFDSPRLVGLTSWAYRLSASLKVLSVPGRVFAALRISAVRRAWYSFASLAVGNVPPSLMPRTMNCTRQVPCAVFFAFAIVKRPAENP